MRHYYERPAVYSITKGITYICDHPIYNEATLYREKGIGLCVIQQRYDPKKKTTTWGAIDPWMVDALYMHPTFHVIFDCYATAPKDYFYPTMTLRNIMAAMNMKPLPQEPWETVFDRLVI